MEALFPAKAGDFALFLLDADGQMAAWFSGAERLYGYNREEVVGRHTSFLDPGGDTFGIQLKQILKENTSEGHLFGNEGWHVRKNGSLFWANVITMPLRNEDGTLHGFATVVRDFSDRHERDEEWRLSRARLRPLPTKSTIAGVVSGEFNQIREVDDPFLRLVGYSREDFSSAGYTGPI
jgi:PAS domain S-box-containing protein